MYILEEACSDASFAATVLFIKRLIDIIFIIGPVLLILLLTIDFTKAVMANNDNRIKQVRDTAIKRVLFAVALLFVPLIVDTSFGLLDKDKGNVISCYNKVDMSYVTSLATKLEAETKEKEAQRQKTIEEIIAKQESEAKKRSKLSAAAKKIIFSNNSSSSNSTSTNNQDLPSKYRKSNGKVAQAAVGDRGRTGTKGDQSGREVTLSGRVPSNATYIARFNDPAKAELVARCGEEGAKNNHIGYGVNDYLSLYREAKKVKFDLSQVKKNVNTVCSTFVAVCIRSAGTKITKNLDGYSKDNESVFKKTGDFKIIKPYSKSKVLRGDIIVLECPGNCGHISIAR